MSNSALIVYTQLSPHCNKPRCDKIRKITIHHAAGNATLQGFGATFCGTREVSANYAVDSRGRVGMYVEECNRAWTSSSPDNDHQAITIEVANDSGNPNWHVSDAALEATINLCVDICKRNGIKRLNFTGDKSGNLTMHKYFAATGCPGPYLESKFPYIASEVNKRLGAGASSAVTYAKLSELVGTANAVITTAFREKGRYWASGWHNGVDIAAGSNTPIYAAADGVVINADSVAKNHDGFGNRVVLSHPDGKATVYGHMIAPAPVKVGQSVKKGQLIGNVGSTGLSTGAHLHFTLIDNYDKNPDIYYKGDLLDPVAVLGLGTLKYSGGGSMSAVSVAPIRLEDVEIGDIVRFKGGGIYITSTAKTASVIKGSSCCRVSNIYNKGKHPIHLISRDGKGVYGWVNASDVESASVGATSGAASTIKVGDIVQFKGGGVYASASAVKASATRGESRCKVTITNSGGKHPIHLVSEDGKGVYGWVDSVNVTK